MNVTIENETDPAYETITGIQKIAFFGSPDLYQKSPDSSKFQFKSGDSTNEICFRSEGCWRERRNITGGNMNVTIENDTDPARCHVKSYSI